MQFEFESGGDKTDRGLRLFCVFLVAAPVIFGLIELTRRASRARCTADAFLWGSGFSDGLSPTLAGPALAGICLGFALADVIAAGYGRLQGYDPAPPAVGWRALRPYGYWAGVAGGLVLTAWGVSTGFCAGPAGVAWQPLPLMTPHAYSWSEVIAVRPVCWVGVRRSRREYWVEMRDHVQIEIAQMQTDPPFQFFRHIGEIREALRDASFVYDPSGVSQTCQGEFSDPHL